MQVKQIVAVNNNYTIGHNGDIPFYNREDLLHFKLHTMNGVVLMGSKTKDSLPKFPLPERYNLVLTRNPNKSYHVSSYEEAIERGKAYYADIKNSTLRSKVLWIIGGSTLYRDTLDIVDEIVMSRINDNFDGDVKYPYEEMLANGFKEYKVHNLKTLQVQFYKKGKHV